MDQSGTRMIAGELCALWTTVFGETFCYVASASDVDGTVRASEDVNKGGSGNGRGWFSRWEMRKVIALGHVRRVFVKPIN